MDRSTALTAEDVFSTRTMSSASAFKYDASLPRTTGQIVACRGKEGPRENRRASHPVSHDERDQKSVLQRMFTF